MIEISKIGFPDVRILTPLSLFSNYSRNGGEKNPRVAGVWFLIVRTQPATTPRGGANIAGTPLNLAESPNYTGCWRRDEEALPVCRHGRMKA